jgi:hypothetical protein
VLFFWSNTPVLYTYHIDLDMVEISFKFDTPSDIQLIKNAVMVI